MDNSTTKLVFKTIDEYIALFPESIQQQLQSLREVIRSAAADALLSYDPAPEVAEKISYQMPTFVLYGNLVHFAAFTRHISLFPGSEPVEHFAPMLTEYHTSKGTIQFPLDEPLPMDLIREIVQFCVKRNMDNALAKRKRKSK